MLRALNILLLTGLLAYGAWLLYGDELTPADRKILFVGNSFTFGGNIPLQVKILAAQAHTPVTYHTRMIAKPAYALRQHIHEGAILNELRSGVWDVVIARMMRSIAAQLAWPVSRPITEDVRSNQ